MHLASINTAEEQRDLQEHIQAYGRLSNIVKSIIDQKLKNIAFG